MEICNILFLTLAVVFVVMLKRCNEQERIRTGTLSCLRQPIPQHRGNVCQGIGFANDALAILFFLCPPLKRTIPNYRSSLLNKGLLMLNIPYITRSYILDETIAHWKVRGAMDA